MLRRNLFSGVFLALVPRGVLAAKVPPLMVSNAGAWPPGVSVRDFGATGDGVTDDRPAIQAAIDSLVNGGEVLFPPGDYLAGSLMRVWRSGITLRGIAATLKLAPGANCSVVELASATPGVVLADIAVDGLTIDGNQADQTGGTPFGIRAAFIQRLRIRGCYLHDVARTGVQIERCGDVLIDGNTLEDVARWTSSGPANGITLVNGIGQPPFDDSRWFRVVNNVVRGHFKDIGINACLNGSRMVVIANNQVTGAMVEEYGISAEICGSHSWDNTEVLIEGNQVSDCGMDGITVGGYATNAHLVTQTVQANQVRRVGSQGIEVIAGNRVMVQNNQVDGFGSMRARGEEAGIRVVSGGSAAHNHDIGVLTIVHNQVWLDPTLAQPYSRMGIFIRPSDWDRMRTVMVHGNQLVGRFANSNAGDRGIALRNGIASLLVTDNQAIGWSVPIEGGGQQADNQGEAT